MKHRTGQFHSSILERVKGIILLKDLVLFHFPWYSPLILLFRYFNNIFRFTIIHCSVLSLVFSVLFLIFSIYCTRSNFLIERTLCSRIVSTLTFYRFFTIYIYLPSSINIHVCLPKGKIIRTFLISHLRHLPHFSVDYLQ